MGFSYLVLVNFIIGLIVGISLAFFEDGPKEKISKVIIIDRIVDREEFSLWVNSEK